MLTWFVCAVQAFGGLTTVRMSLRGFQSSGRHGLHVHETGSLEERCMKAGSHFNPRGKQHGAPYDTDR